MTVTAILLVLGAYVLGSLSSGIIVCRLLGLPDPRTEGSQNPGATNVLRIAGKKAAAITLAGDSLKGLLPMLVAHAVGADATVLAGVAMAAFLGHLYPVFFRFQGGKGVATALGVLFGLDWKIGLGVALLWLLMARLTRISSLSALVSLASAPLLIWWIRPAPALIIMSCLMTLMLFWRHRENIHKLISGTESRIGADPPDSGN
jgi:glycerol-3-phosphate acyltransferase PlsY